MPLLLEGTNFFRHALLARQSVHVRITEDLSSLEEAEALSGWKNRGQIGGGGGGGGRGGGGRGAVRQHRLDEVESVTPGGSGGAEGSSPVFVIRFRGKGQASQCGSRWPLLYACSKLE